MSLGEKAELTIDSEWAYGRKGLPDAGYVIYYTHINTQVDHKPYYDKNIY